MERKGASQAEGLGSSVNWQRGGWSREESRRWVAGKGWAQEGSCPRGLSISLALGYSER
jgi:hypothetical protein